jgi:hypothetical protein
LAIRASLSQVVTAALLGGVAETVALPDLRSKSLRIACAIEIWKKKSHQVLNVVVPANLN